jgi:hypothetical protein
MSTFGVSMVKDEADVVASTLTHLADEVDHLLVADNGSTDGTREILAELADTLPLTVLDDPEPAYYQSPKMTALAARAAEDGASWIVPFDADEVWVWRGRRIREEVAGLPPRITSVRAELFNHFPSAVDLDDPDPMRSIVWRQAKPAPLPKVAFRWAKGAVIHQGNHGVDLPGKWIVGLEVRHFPYRSAEQFVNKARNGAAAYRATDLPVTQGAHWRAYGDLLDRYGPEALEDVFREHFWHLSPVDAGMVHDPAPYCRWKPQS